MEYIDGMVCFGVQGPEKYKSETVHESSSRDTGKGKSRTLENRKRDQQRKKDQEENVQRRLSSFSGMSVN